MYKNLGESGVHSGARVLGGGRQAAEWTQARVLLGRCDGDERPRTECTLRTVGMRWPADPDAGVKGRLKKISCFRRPRLGHE